MKNLQALVMKASDVLGLRMGVLATGILLNGRLDVSALVVNPGGDCPLFSDEENSNASGYLLNNAAIDVLYLIEDSVDGSEESEQNSEFSFFDEDGDAICLLVNPQDQDLQASLLRQMQE